MCRNRDAAGTPERKTTCGHDTQHEHNHPGWHDGNTLAAEVLTS